MPTYIGKSGRTITTTSSIGKGGEGEVFAFQGDTHEVVKGYFPQERTNTRQQKLSHMISLQPAPQRTAWPREIVFEGGEFAGFTMPKVENCREINEIYAIKDLEYRLAVAHYLCDAVQEIHAAGHVCGDLQPKNVLVSPHGQVTLVDADSFHIQNPNNPSRPFRCDKGLADFLAPEIQSKMVNGQTLVTAPLPTFTRETDLFTVAIHIFALFMNGCHPFATRVTDLVLSQRRSSVTNPLPNENIKNGFSPFLTTRPGYDIPVYAPPLSSLPVEIQQLFRRAFVEGHTIPSRRPTCWEWANALKKWRNDLFGTPKWTSSQLPLPQSHKTARQGSHNTARQLPMPSAFPKKSPWPAIFSVATVVLVIVLVIFLGALLV